MQRRDFHYDLPTELIAQQPLGERAASRLLCLDGATGALADRRFSDLPELLTAGDLVVFNDTRVIPARLFGAKDSGGRVEVLVERTMEDQRVLAHVRASKPPRPGTGLVLGDGIRVEVESREQDLYVLRFDDRRPVLELLERYGHVPLPPYIRRGDDKLDRDRYQTVYARRRGAVAAAAARTSSGAETTSSTRPVMTLCSPSMPVTSSRASGMACAAGYIACSSASACGTSSRRHQETSSVRAAAASPPVDP